MPAKPPKSFRTTYQQDLALLITVNCVRNTILEDYHAAGKISDPEIKAFNIEVSNRIYTVLSILMKEDYADIRQDFMEAMKRNYPDNWNKPEIDTKMLPGKDSWQEFRRFS